jgi:hypothetical protein
VEEVLLRTRCKVSEGEMALTAGEYKYTLPTGVLAIVEMKLTSGGEEHVFEPTSDAEVWRMLRSNPNTSSGARYYALSGANLLLVYPTPAAADTVYFLYVPRPATLSGAGDTPSEIPSEFHKAVTKYALKEAADWADDVSAAQGARYEEEFDKEIARIRKAISRKRGQRLGRVVIGRRPLAETTSSRSRDLG